MEIYSKGEYPSDMLSNFAAHTFELDGVVCNSMEGFLQGLKYRNPARQARICLLVGKDAKLAGKNKWLWKIMRTVWWRGKPIKRLEEDFQRLIDRAYDALYENADFRRALLDSGEEPLLHSMGKTNPRKTVLTEREFVTRLERLREKEKEEN